MSSNYMNEMRTNIIHPWLNFCPWCSPPGERRPGPAKAWSTLHNNAAHVRLKCINCFRNPGHSWTSNQQMVKLLTCNYKQITLSFTLDSDQKYDPREKYTMKQHLRASVRWIHWCGWEEGYTLCSSPMRIPQRKILFASGGQEKEMSSDLWCQLLILRNLFSRHSTI